MGPLLLPLVSQKDVGHYPNIVIKLKIQDLLLKSEWKDLDEKSSPDNILHKSASWLFPTSANTHLSKILILQKDQSNIHEHPKSYLWGKKKASTVILIYKQATWTNALKLVIFPQEYSPHMCVMWTVLKGR